MMIPPIFHLWKTDGLLQTIIITNCRCRSGSRRVTSGECVLFESRSLFVSVDFCVPEFDQRCQIIRGFGGVYFTVSICCSLLCKEGKKEINKEREEVPGTALGSGLAIARLAAMSMRTKENCILMEA